MTQCILRFPDDGFSFLRTTQDIKNLPIILSFVNHHVVEFKNKLKTIKEFVFHLSYLVPDVNELLIYVSYDVDCGFIS